ncbi:hypothetical protein BCR33DRAFT_716404, partial [Rhizoclosmatium globosum]
MTRSRWIQTAVTRPAPLSSQALLNPSSATNPTGTEHKSKWHGSEHWMAERFYSILLIPSLATSLIAGPVFVNDLVLGVLLPVHVHMGFDCMIQDYIPARKYGIWHTVSTWTLRVVTGIVLYGLFTFNTMDVGITAFVQKLWTGTSKRELRLKVED